MFSRVINYFLKFNCINGQIDGLKGHWTCDLFQFELIYFHTNFKV